MLCSYISSRHAPQNNYHPKLDRGFIAITQLGSKFLTKIQALIIETPWTGTPRCMETVQEAIHPFSAHQAPALR